MNQKSAQNLMDLFIGLRKEAFEKTNGVFVKAAKDEYEAATAHTKTAIEKSDVDQALFLHSVVP